MTQPFPPTRSSGLRVFSASLLSALLIMMPFVQLAAAQMQRSGARGQKSEAQVSLVSSQGSDTNAAPENVFLNAPIPKPAPEPPALLAPIIVATKDDGLAAAATVAPNGAITYTINIQNNGAASPADDATNVQFSDTIDSHTTLVAGSPVAAVSDRYNTIGNTQISVPDGSTDLLGNDFDPPGTNAGMTVTAYGATTGTEQTSMGTPTATAQGGSVTVNAVGSFTYDPPLGFEGTDTFKYRAADADGFTAITSVTITIAGMIWYVNNNAGACTSSCDGRLSHPFQTLAAFQAVNNGTGSNPAAGDNIFLYESATAYVGPVTLLNNQRFIGQDATASLQSITGLTAPSGSDPFPVMNTGAPSVTITGSNANGVNLGVGNTLRGFTVGNTGTGTKISGNNFGTLIVGNAFSPDVTLNGTGQALNLTTGTLSVVGGFVSVATTSSAAQGISLSGVSDDGPGPFSFGSTTVSGSTTQGIFVGTTTADINFGNTAIGTVSAGSGGTDGISFQTNLSGTRTFGTLSIQNNTQIGFMHAAGGGLVNVNGATAITNPGTIGISVDSSTGLVSFANASVTQSGGAGVSFTNNSNVNGNLTFADLDISPDANQIALLTNANNSTITATSGTIVTSGASALSITGTPLALVFDSITTSGGSTSAISLTTANGSVTAGSGSVLTGNTTIAPFFVSGGGVVVTYNGNITQASNAALVSIQGGHNGTITFQTGTLSATSGTGLQFDNADGTYNFNGTTTLIGGDAGIDILNGAGGTFAFGGTTITNPTGVALNVSSSSGAISISGPISKTSGGRLIDFDNYDTGTANISSSLSCTTSCDGIEVTNNGATSGTVNFSNATKTLNTGADIAVNLDNNDGGAINFTGNGLDIDTTTGIGFNATNGGTVTVTGTGNSINSVSATALNIVGTDIGANDVIFERIDSGNSTAAADPASGIVLNTTGSVGGLNVTGTGTTDGSGGTIQSTLGDGIVLMTTRSVVLKNMIIGDNAAVHTEGVSSTNNIGDDGISSTSVTPVAGDTYGLDIDNLKIARTAGGGIDGAGGGNIGLHVNNTEIINPGDVGTPSSTSSDEDAIGYGSGFAGNADQLSGTVLIENSTFAAFIDHGFQVENAGSGTLNATISNVTMKNNDGLTLCSGGPCEGSAIQVIADGSTIAGGTGPTINLTVKQLTVTNIDQDGIDAIADPGGNINVTVGDPANNATNGITFNCPNGDQVLRFNSGSPDSDDNATFNFNVRNVIVQQSPGTLVIFKAANQMTGKFINSTLDQNNATANTLASRGIEITADGDASTPGSNEVPAMTILIDNVTLNRIGGDGIQAFLTDVTNSSSRLDLTIQNSNIGTNPANTAQTGLEIGLNNSLASEGIEIRNGVTNVPANANGQMYVHLSNNNIRNATSTSGSADGIDIDAEFSTISHVTVVNNDIFAAPGTTDYDLAVEAATAFMCADFTGNNDSNDANSGADILNNGDPTTDFQIEGGSGSLAGNNPGTSPFNLSGTFGSGICTMPNVPTGGFFALNSQSNPQIYLASLTTQVANDLPVDIFASAENALTIATLPATGAATMTQPSLVNQVANVLAHSAGEVHSLIASSGHQVDVSSQKAEIRTHHAPSSKLETRNTKHEEDSGLRAHYASLSKLATRSATTPTATMAGETVTANIGTLPAGGSATITFQVTVNNPPNLTLLSPPRVENQGTVTADNGINVLTDDPETGTAGDKTATRINLFDTTTSLTCAPDPSNSGEQVTCTATITETETPSPGGTVDFIDTSNANAIICDNAAVASNQATCQTSSLTAGTHNIRADYSGDGNFDSSQSTLYAQDVVACTTNPVVTKIADTNDGVCDADCSLREAIATTCAGSTITFNTAGVFATAQTILLGGTELSVGRNVTIDGPDAAINHVTVNGDSDSRVFNINSGKTVTLRDFTITNGSTTGNGGAILNDHAVLVLLKMTISGNTASVSGGGIFSDGAGGTATLNIIQSTISGNTAPTNGGGIGNDGTGGTANLTITNSTLSGNNAGESGGGLHDTGTLTVYNSTFTENRADNDNNATGTGGGIFRGAGSGTLHNTIVAGNFNDASPSTTSDDVSGALETVSSFNLIGDGTGLTGISNATNGNQVGAGGSPIDAKLGPLDNNGGPTMTHALLAGSPAIEAGSNTIADGAGLTEDQRGTGYPRKTDSADADTSQIVDIGAFELHPSIENIADQITNEDTAINFDFKIGDDTGALITTVTATSSNTTLVPNANLVITDPAPPGGGFRNLSITPAANQSGTTTITVTVTATNGRTAVDTFELTVASQNDAPAITSDGGGSAANINAAENQTAVTTVTSSDVDGGTPSYSIVGGADQLKFSINSSSGALTFNTAPDFETPTDAGTNNVYLVNVQVSDGNGGTDQQDLSITVTNQNEPPAITSNGGGPTASINAAENQTAVTTVTSSDVDGGTPSYSIVGGADQLKFSINSSSGALTFNTAPDFETPTDANTDNVYEVTVEVSDGNGGTDSQAISVTVTNANEAPVISSNGGGPTASVNAAENQTAVTTVTSNDVDGGTPAYSITGGADSAAFSIGSSSGVLTFNSAPNFETPTDANTDGVYEVTVEVSDGNGGTDSQAISVTVTNVNEAPVNTVPGGQGTPSNTNLTFSSGNGNQISVADVDAGSNSIQVSLSVTNGTLTLNGTTGLNFGCGGCSGDGTADSSMVFQGSLANINNALNGMVFTPTAAFSGTAVLSITTDDLGNTGSGGAQSDGPDTVNIQVAMNISINDAVVVEPSSGTVDMVFTVALNAPAPAGGVTVNFTTNNGTANSGTCPPVGSGDFTTATGSVSFTAGQQVKTINVPICSDAVSEGDETLTVTLSNPTGGTIFDGTATGTIKAAAEPAGDVLISELRTRGPGGEGDDFIELYNNTDSPKDISGFGLFKKGPDCNLDSPVLIATIPGAPGSNTTVIPARGHYLLVGSQYSLANYGGTLAAAGNQTLTSDLETDANVGLFSTADPASISTLNRVDAVGFGLNVGGTCNLLREGSTLPSVAGNAATEHSFFRKICEWVQGSGCTVPNLTPKDTNNNAVDFWLADTQGTDFGGGNQRLGAPGPQRAPNSGDPNSGSPIRRDVPEGSSGINVFPLDNTKSRTASVNRDRNNTVVTNGQFGTLTLRLRVFNNTGAPVTRLRYRIIDASTRPAAVGTADVRAVTGEDEVLVNQVHDPATCAGATPCTVVVNKTTLEEPPVQPFGGGFNATLSSGTVTMAQPLATSGPTQTILINIRLGVMQTGAFRFYVIVEALP